MPKPLPPDPPLQWDAELLGLLSDATTALGRLDGMAGTLPDPDWFVASYVRREAVLSSQIEGTQSSLDDLFAHEVQARVTSPVADIHETVNYVRAMRLGLELLSELPLSGRLIRNVHQELMTGTRGQERTPGEFRKSQNWVGPAGCTLETAAFVPPSPDDLGTAIRDLEVYLNDSDDPPLVLAGLAHAQFETIHPFLDGNGRIGRLLITLLLVQRGALSRPLLYLSLFLKQNRLEYYDRLNAVRTHGDWEGWLKFFLTGVNSTASDAVRVAGELSALTDEHRRIATSENFGKYGWPLLNLLAEQPILTIKYATAKLGATSTTIGSLFDRLVELGLVVEITGHRRNRVYRYSPFLDILADDATE
ncbi:MAG: Fic family protein [Acidimicrobiaceae bacterium]|nr:Fic family protein [Acidimicrobiaceae bacterium]